MATELVVVSNHGRALVVTFEATHKLVEVVNLVAMAMDKLGRVVRMQVTTGTHEQATHAAVGTYKLATKVVIGTDKLATQFVVGFNMRAMQVIVGMVK